MYHNISPATLYQEYETRVAKAVQNRRRVADAQPVARPTGRAWNLYRLGLFELRRRIARQLQPAEVGYIA